MWLLHGQKTKLMTKKVSSYLKIPFYHNIYKVLKFSYLGKFDNFSHDPLQQSFTSFPGIGAHWKKNSSGLSLTYMLV